METEAHLVVFLIDPRHRREFEALMLLFTRGLEDTNLGEYEGPIKLDVTDRQIIDGLAALHGHLAADEHGAEMTTWNSARLLLGDEPHPLPPAREEMIHDEFRFYGERQFGDIRNSSDKEESVFALPREEVVALV